jgi:hypothetical protein
MIVVAEPAREGFSYQNHEKRVRAKIEAAC